MDMLDDELLRYRKCLGEYHVNYIMVGDFATYFHGFSHPKDVLDIWLDDTLDNRKNLRAAFKALG